MNKSHLEGAELGCPDGYVEGFALIDGLSLGWDDVDGWKLIEGEALGSDDEGEALGSDVEGEALGFVEIDGRRLLVGMGDGWDDVDGRNVEGVLLGVPLGKFGIGLPQISTSSSGLGFTS